MAVRCAFVGHSFYVEPIYKQAVKCHRCAGRWSPDGWRLQLLGTSWERGGDRLEGKQLVRLAEFWSERAINRNRGLTDEQKANLRELSKRDPAALLRQLPG